MVTVVQKYGGSSLADVERLRVVARCVVERRRAGDGVVVVVSAMGETTDALLEQATRVAPEPPQRELDMLVTAGERISMALVSMAIHEEGEEAISFTGSQSGIITEDAHQGARIISVRPYRLEEALQEGRIVIVAGYQGVSLKKEITTLGRGGSDTTAVALAAALGAEACEIYSDVDGVYSADPRVCPQAKLIPEIKYESMQAMAGAGAKVLNADAVEFAKRAGIEIRARKTGDDSGRQTVVHDAAPETSEVLAVVGNPAVTRLTGDIAPAELPNVIGDIATLGGRVMSVAGGELWVYRGGLPGESTAALDQLAAARGQTAESIGVVSLVGANLAGRAELYRRSSDALTAADLAPTSCHAAEGVVRWTFEPARCDDAVRALHREWVEEG